ncbi:hypothetical protein OROMI_028995 [Orobanche minor]
MFRIGLCQLRVTADKESNILHARSTIEEAAEKGAKLVVLPEIWNSPYSNDSFPLYAEDIDAGVDASPSTAMLSEIARLSKITIIGGSIPERSGDKLYNTCCVFGPDGKLKAKHRKIHLFDIDIPGKITFKESKTLTAGDTPTTVDTGIRKNSIVPCLLDSKMSCLASSSLRYLQPELNMPFINPFLNGNFCTIEFLSERVKVQYLRVELATLGFFLYRSEEGAEVGRIGIGICYDINFQELAMLYAARVCSIDLLSWSVQHDYGTFTLGITAKSKAKGAPRRFELPSPEAQGSRATDNQLYVATCSPARDAAAGYVAWGHSTLVGPFGEVLATTEHDEAILISEIDYSQIKLRRTNLPIENQRRGDLYQLVDVQRLGSN